MLLCCWTTEAVHGRSAAWQHASTLSRSDCTEQRLFPHARGPPVPKFLASKERGLRLPQTSGKLPYSAFTSLGHNENWQGLTQCYLNLKKNYILFVDIRTRCSFNLLQFDGQGVTINGIDESFEPYIISIKVRW